LSSKILQQHKDHFATLAVEAVLRLEGSTDLEHIQIIKKPGGLMKDSFLDEGFILNKSFGMGQPQKIENAKILIANTSMDTDKIKIYGAKVKTNSILQLGKIEEEEKLKMKDKVNKIIDHGCTLFINRQLIYNYPEELMTEAGLNTIEHADFDGVERLSLVLGGDIVSTFETKEQVTLGTCKTVEEIMIGEDKVVRFSGCASGKACSIVLRGASKSLLDEAERSLHDALCVLSQTANETRIVLGGGCSEMLMSKAVLELAKVTTGKKALAMEAYARALRQLPTIIADNAGLDSTELVSNLEAEHFKGNSTCGIDVLTGGIGDVAELKITESFKVKNQVLLSATEAAELILRVDEVIRCAPRQRK
jgi:T-complex protein 1 subunit beta